jgi:hypothetical protein
MQSVQRKGRDITDTLYKSVFFWDVMLHGLEDGYQHSGQAYCPHFQEYGYSEVGKQLWSL